jgi:amino acid adenylation domain-containing protein
MASGEALPPDLVRRFYTRIHGAALHNLYGPTEASVDVSHWTCEPAAERVPIGRPIANLRLHVVDRDLQPQPAGVAGELLLGGIGLARGYLARPDLTAAAFVPDPFATEPGDRLYRTGDLARTLPDGNVEYLGRIDFQVKIRGVRIELGEIEAVLGSHPAVRECVVVVREDIPGARLLAAYVAGADLPPAAELRDFLAGKLPEALVPAVFVPLDSLPLSPNGKVDRRALPAPERPRSSVDAAEARPADPLEEMVAGIWAEVLGLDAVGRDDDFFALGGHSLLATQVASRVRGGLGVDVPLRRLFETRTLAAFAAQVRAALQEGAPEARPITPRPRDGEGPELPLSFAQQRLWFLDQLDPGDPAYNLPVAVRLAGDLDPGVLARAFAEVVRRHEALRTVFRSVDGAPFQEVVPELTPELPVRDLRDLPAAEREPRAWAFVAEESRQSFDLRRGPLLRLHLLRLADQDHLLLVTLHHIVADGWSIGLLVREIAALYEAFAAGRPSPLPELPVQYADFARWQRDRSQGGQAEVLEAQLAYWRRQLAGAPAVLDLPTDHPRPAVHTSRGAFRQATFSPDLSAALHEVSRREGATPFMAALAVWAVLLARHTRQEDLVLGTPVAGRNRREIEGLIGFFVNTLALRADLAGSPTFAELLGRIRQTALEGLAHQDLPFERLVEELVTDRDLSHLSLVETVLAFQNLPTRTLEVPGLTLTPAPVDTGVSKFDLGLTLQEGPAGLEAFLEHNADLFEPATAGRLLARFETLLRAALDDPETGIWDLPMLLDAERVQIAGWTGTAGEPVGETLHGRFAAQARRTPDAVAVTCEGAGLTYEELDRRSDLLARRLRQTGVGPESPVGLCLPRSLDLVAGILGILKAGGAYVPLDPAYPRERLAYMIEDAGIRAVVTHAELAPAFEGVPEVLPVPEVLATTAGDSEPLTAPVEGAHLAYVIYTSGSTGRPKGTLVTHGNAVRLFDAAQPAFGFGPQDVWTLFHSYAFDFSVWEIWGALLYGGRLVVVPHEVSRDPGQLHGLLERERVTVLNQTPSAFAQLQRAGEEPARAGALSSLRWVIFGGEALDPAALVPWFARHGDERPALVNMYGITETTVHVTHRQVRHADALGERRSLIGSPLPDLSLYVAEVLGEGLQTAPVGVPGELIVGGAGLARGYLGRPDLTAERFVPDPWSGRPGARLYRSGDLGRFLPPSEGTAELEYLGRIDHQVKIRGFRIELGEIQAALAAHPAVRECAVVDRQDTAGTTFLAAYVVGRPEAPADPAELRGFLAGRLPDYMVPSAFVSLEALPLTPTGKLDRRGLPAPDRGRREGSGEIVPPRTPTEEIVVEIWKGVLALDQVSVEDGFFDLGGHSLLATQALARVQQAFGVEVTLRELFQNPSPAALSARVDERLSAPAAVSEDELAGLLDELDGLSDEEARARLEALMS